MRKNMGIVLSLLRLMEKLDKDPSFQRLSRSREGRQLRKIFLREVRKEMKGKRLRITSFLSGLSFVAEIVLKELMEKWMKN
jgi:hypothetical protein